MAKVAARAIVGNSEEFVTRNNQPRKTVNMGNSGSTSKLTGILINNARRGTTVA